MLRQEKESANGKKAQHYPDQSILVPLAPLTLFLHNLSFLPLSKKFGAKLSFVYVKFPIFC